MQILNYPYSLLVSSYTLENQLISLGFIPQLLTDKFSSGGSKTLSVVFTISCVPIHGINSGLFIFIYLPTLTQSPATFKIFSLKMYKSPQLYSSPGT